jgi:phosphate-selective porin OprO/OprP
MKNKEAVFHLGAEFSKGESPIGTGFGTIRTEARGATYFTQPILLNTTSLDKAIDRTRFNLEAAVASGPFKVQTQYVRVSHDFIAPTSTSAGTGVSPDINTYYVEALWALTGEKHADRYKAGAFGGIKPTKEFDASTFTGGAWELGARYSAMDASDFQNILPAVTNAVTAGTGYTKAKAYTLGVKFVPNMNTRYMLDYVGSDFESPVAGTSTLTVNNRQETQEKAVLFRTQFMF